MRSFMISEKNFTTQLIKAGVAEEIRVNASMRWVGHGDIVLACMTTLPIYDVVDNYQCSRCLHYFDRLRLAVWCVDCQVVSYTCTECF